MNALKLLSWIVPIFFLLTLLISTNKTFAQVASCNASEFNFYGKCLTIFNILGQKSIYDITEDTPTDKKIYHASGLVIDKSTQPNKLYVVDKGNNRILGYKDISKTNTPDIIIGQPDSQSVACNDDSNLGIGKSPSNTTLCLIAFPHATNLQEAWGRLNMDVDKNGNLFVVDLYNNRILVYYNPLSDNHSNGQGDQVADFVIGQPDFTTNSRKGTSNNQLNLFDGIGTASIGVSVDHNLNVWISDTQNHRILRFSPNSATANLVIGQPSFTSSQTDICHLRPEQAPLNKLCRPTLAKIDPQTGKLYVIDEFEGEFRARILVYEAPLSNNKPASYTIIPDQSSFSGWNFFQATGFTFNSYQQAEYANGKLWITEHSANRVILVNDNSQIIKSIGSEDDTKRGCDYAYYGQCKGSTALFDNYNLCWPGGSVGIDSNNNMYLADEQFHRVSIFSLPYNRTTKNNRSCVPDPVGGLYLGTTPNSITASGIRTTTGIDVFNNQLIVGDDLRLLIWDDYLNTDISSPANKVIGQTSLSLRQDTNHQLSPRTFHTVDKQNRLWTVNKHHRLVVYQLPFTNGQNYLANFVKLYWADAPNQEINYSASSVSYDKKRDAIWIVDKQNHRILKVNNYHNLNDKLLVTMVLGQKNKTDTKCNQTQDGGWIAPGPPTANSLCDPLDIEFDNFGNLFVVENNYECHGNNRIIMYTSQNVTQASNLFPQINASKVFVRNSLTEQAKCNYSATDEPFSPISVAFNSHNHMIIGNDGYYANNNERPYKQIWYYENPLKKDAQGQYIQGQKPDAYIDTIMGSSGEIKFDQLDNLIIKDHTWNRIWIINYFCDPELLKPVNGYVPSNRWQTKKCKALADYNQDYHVDIVDAIVLNRKLFTQNQPDSKNDINLDLKNNLLDIFHLIDYKSNFYRLTPVGSNNI